VLDHPCVDWEPLAPGNAGIGAQPPEQPVTFTTDLVRSDSDAACLDRVDSDPARRQSSGIRLCSVQGRQGGCHDVFLSADLVSAVTPAAPGASLEEEIRARSHIEDMKASLGIDSVSLR
jgi:hypothetical protein